MEGCGEPGDLLLDPRTAELPKDRLLGTLDFRWRQLWLQAPGSLCCLQDLKGPGRLSAGIPPGWSWGRCRDPSRRLSWGAPSWGWVMARKGLKQEASGRAGLRKEALPALTSS